MPERGRRPACVKSRLWNEKLKATTCPVYQSARIPMIGLAKPLCLASLVRLADGRLLFCSPDDLLAGG